MDLEEQLAAFSQRSLKHLQANEIGDAVLLAESSVKLAMALARLNGQSHHTITVRRVEKALPEEPPLPADAAPLPPPYEGEPPLFTKEEWDSDTLTNEVLWARNTARQEERARRAGWI